MCRIITSAHRPRIARVSKSAQRLSPGSDKERMGGCRGGSRIPNISVTGGGSHERQRHMWPWRARKRSCVGRGEGPDGVGRREGPAAAAGTNRALGLWVLHSWTEQAFATPGVRSGPREERSCGRETRGEERRQGVLEGHLRRSERGYGPRGGGRAGMASCSLLH